MRVRVENADGGGVFPVLVGWRYSRYLPSAFTVTPSSYYQLTERLPGQPDHDDDDNDNVLRSTHHTKR